MMSYSAVIVVIVVTVLRDVHGRASSGVSATSRTVDDVGVGVQCRYNAVPNTIMTIPFLMLLKGQECLMPSAAFQRKLDAANDTATYRQVFQTACLQEEIARACLVGVQNDAPACLNIMESRMLETVYDTVTNSISATCANGSETLSRVYGDELSALRAADQLRVVACVSSSRANTLFDREVDIPAYTMRRYTAMEQGRICIEEVARNAGVGATEFDKYIGRIIGSMKCISPVTEEVVDCDTLAGGSNTPAV